jgi:hypothetical protein
LLSTAELEDGASVVDDSGAASVVLGGAASVVVGFEVGAFCVVVLLVVSGGGEVLVGFVSSEVVVVSAAGGDVVVSAGGAEVLVTAGLDVTLSSSSCLRWIAAPWRPASTLMNVASATDIAESPRTKALSALLSCIVTDFAARWRDEKSR